MFDPLEQQEIIAMSFLDAAAVEQKKGRKTDHKRLEDLLEKASRVIDRITPYRYPGLARWRSIPG